MMKKFLWGGFSVERKMYWVARDRVTSHKKEGGLGLSKLADLNVALLSKWGWRFKTEGDSLWKNVIEAIHSNRVGWESIPFKKSAGGTWRNIAKVFIKFKVNNDPIRNCIKGIIGNGESIVFWLDPWVVNEPLKVRYPALFSLEVSKKCKVKDRIRQGSGQFLLRIGRNSRFRRLWLRICSNCVIFFMRFLSARLRINGNG
ncbi:hypothetical protein HanIR_Chr05g0223121 [Helianthus annuus]|nr:hypothetical protein HanIR_Chr05g0223121 [Helianthus annuus]